ncbi:MAG: hypothetical protein LBO67_10305 [Spirochaetaceae bacterium]|jgi:hypothetical protein|nr:hypothetical protein [Spirochaetaceae bacterium]
MQLDFEINTGRRAESFFTQMRSIVSGISVRAKKMKSVSEGGKHYVLVRAKGIEEEMLEQIIDYAQKTKDTDFERAAKEAMKHTFNKAQAVITQAEAKQKWEDFLSTVFLGAGYAKRNTVGEAAFAVEWSDDKAGMGLELLELLELHWSLLPLHFSRHRVVYFCGWRL